MFEGSFTGSTADALEALLAPADLLALPDEPAEVEGEEPEDDDAPPLEADEEFRSSTGGALSLSLTVEHAPSNANAITLISIFTPFMAFLSLVG